VQFLKSVKKKKYDLLVGNLIIKRLIKLPDNEIIKVFSKGDISSINFINLVANNAKINELTASTLRVGEKEIRHLNLLHIKGKIDKATFIFSNIMRKAGKVEKKYNYFNVVLEICKKNNWEIIEKNNHSKILLFDTDKGKYVLETSSNLNENPKNEQFSFEKSSELYDWYYQILREVN
jgi:hypothetical protein